MQQQELVDKLTAECDAFVDRFNKTYKFTKCTAETLRGIKMLADNFVADLAPKYFDYVKLWEVVCDLSVNPISCLDFNHAHIELSVVARCQPSRVLRFNIPVPDRGSCMRGVDFYQVA